MTTKVDESIRVEQNCIKNFERLGYGLYTAVAAVDQRVDWHEVDNLLKKGCPSTLALKIAGFVI
jgi:hypothetical protein